MDPAPTDASFFASTRERRLWIWTVIVVATIFSTLGLAQVLSGALRSRNLFDTFFIAGFLLIWVAIVTQALKARPSVAEIGVGIGIAGVYAMVFARMGIPEERTHLFEYGLVAVLVYHALAERRRHGRSVPPPGPTALVVTALLGWLDEGIQWLLPDRVYDLRDVGFNALAGLMAVAATMTLEWTRRRARSLPL